MPVTVVVHSDGLVRIDRWPDIVREYTGINDGGQHESSGLSR
jgi:hypothetical protein